MVDDARFDMKIQAQVTYNGKLRQVTVEYGYNFGTGSHIKAVWLRDRDIKHSIPLSELRGLERLCDRMSMEDNFAKHVDYWKREFESNRVAG
jgi:hypothetical protein